MEAGAMARADRQWWNRYNRYLNSQGWQLTREACFKRDGYRCRRCGVRGSPLNPLQADHLTYQNYNATGRTPIGDLRTLCRLCHQIVSRWRFTNRRLSMRRLIRFAVTAAAIWLLALQFRPVHPDHPLAASSNTLVVPSQIHFHHHYRHHRQPPAGD
jgi:5-methylcytosine-specific restriction endonuclease McrA